MKHFSWKVRQTKKGKFVLLKTEWPNQHSKDNIYLRVAVSFNIHQKVFSLKVRQTGDQGLTTNIKRELFVRVLPIKVKKKKENIYFLFET